MKESLTENEAQELAHILNEHAFLSMTAKTYWSSNITFTPIVRVQAYADLESLAKKYGGSVYDFPIRHQGQTPKSSWTWNQAMMKTYLPLLLPHLTEEKAAKANLIIEALKLSRGRGRPPQDKQKLREIYLKIKKLQEPRGQTTYPWEQDDSPFRG
jgi:hypothetical protein